MNQAGMRVDVVRRDTLFTLSLLSVGALAVLLAFAADWLPSAAAGFGPSQRVLLGLGTVLIGTAGALRAGWLPLSKSSWFAQQEQVQSGELLRFLGIAAQLVVLVLVMRLVRLENPAFYEKVLTLALVGFVIHHLLPLRFRLPFFLALSLTGICWVFGWLGGLSLISIGALLIGICHLPIRFGRRVVLLLAAATVLALARGGLIAAPWPGGIWPILGSMFMFRLIAYMYDLRHSKEKPSLIRAAAYFFLLPNVVFPLFPVVDYATFRRTYFDQPALIIYQRGIRWMLIGLTHLLLYRIVYQQLTLSPADVASVGDLVQYMVANFGLYLRVSGQFHLIVGLLHLFGFRLPETHRFFFLAASFTDFWRRINVYWKDFMMKVFYYPAYFRLRRLGDTVALIVATLFVFFVTWVTHSYQWFWLLGTVLISWTDTLFWGMLAALLVVNSLWEVKRGRVRSLGKLRRTPAQSVNLALRITGTFCTICFLWALWTSPTMADWWLLWSNVQPAFADVAGLLAGLGGVAALLALGDQLLQWRGSMGVARVQQPAFGSAFLATSVAMLALLLLVQPATTSRVLSPGTARNLLLQARNPDLNMRDAAQLQRGYYERLTGVNRFNGQLWELYAAKSVATDNQWALDHIEAGVTRRIDDFRYVELMPEVEVVFRGARLTTNRWGMRDRDYTLTPPANTYRIAVQGASYVMGEGVGDDETFEALLEQKLNHNYGQYGTRFEVLNFAVPNYSAVEQTALLETRIVRFRPDALLRIAHQSDADDVAWVLAKAVVRKLPIPYPELREIVTRADVKDTMKQQEAHQRLVPFSDEILEFVYRRSVEVAAKQGMRAVWVMVPTPGPRRAAAQNEQLKQKARHAGFQVLDIGDPYQGFVAESLYVAEWDRHPNARGHQLIADRLFTTLRRAGFFPEPPAYTKASAEDPNR